MKNLFLLIFIIVICGCKPSKEQVTISIESQIDEICLNGVTYYHARHDVPLVLAVDADLKPITCEPSETAQGGKTNEYNK